MKLLFVVYDFYPAGSAEATLLKKLIYELKNNNNCEVEVLTTKTNIDDECIEYIDNIKIYRMAFAGNYSYKDLKFGIKYIYIFIAKCINYIANKFRHKHFFNKLLMKKMYKGLKKNNLDYFDFYIPTCGFYEMYLAAKLYLDKNQLNKKLILYQLDPLANNFVYSPKSDLFRKELENSLSVDCDAVIATKNLIDQKILLNIDISNCWMLELPNIEKWENSITNLKKEEDKKIALFAGTLNLKIRNPFFTFELFSKLQNNIKLVVAGNCDYALISDYIVKYPEKFEYVGIKNSIEMNKLIKEADFLVNIGNNDIYFIPSKIYEYISTGKPIINTCKTKECPTIEILENYFDNSFTLLEVDNDINLQINKLNCFINNNYNKIIKYEEIEKNYYIYTSKFIGEQLFKNLRNLDDKNN